MAQKPKFLKNLLTTASALAVITSAGTAWANDTVSLVNGATTANPANWQRAAAVGIPIDNAAAMIFVGGVHNLTFEAAIAGRNLGRLNLNGHGDITVTVTANNTLENIINDAVTYVGQFTAAKGANPVPTVGANANAKANFEIGNAIQIFKAVDKLGNIKFTNANGTAQFNADNVTVNGTINGNGANEGKIVVNANNVTFKGAIGSVAKIDSLKLNNGKSATLVEGITANGNIELDANSILTINPGKTVTAADITGVAADNGTLIFSGGATVNSKIGNAFKLLKVQVGAGTVDFREAVYKAATTEFNDDAAAFKFNLLAGTAAETNFKTTINGKGKIIVHENAGIKGTIGEDANRLEAIHFSADKILTLEKAAVDLFVNGVTTAAPNTGKLKFKADTVNIYSDIGAEGKVLNLVSLTQSVAGGPAVVTSTLKEGKKIYATEFDIAEAAATNNVLALENNTEVHANVKTSNVGNGVIKVQGDSTIDGTIGVVGGNALNKIEFATADKILTLTKNDIAVANLDFTQHGTLKFTQNANFETDAALVITIPADATGKGTVQINNADSGKTVTIKNAVGDIATNKSLRLLEVKGGANTILSESAAIKKIDIGSQDSKLQLNKAGGVYKFEFAHENNKGVLEVNQNNITLKEGTVISTEASRLKQFDIIGDQTVTFEDGINIYTGTNGIRNNAAGTGTLVFEGSHVVDAAIGLNNVFKAIEIKGKDEVVDFRQDVKLDTAANGTITIYEGATAIFGGNVQGKAIDAKAANVNGQGTIIFANEAAKEVNLTIGDTNLINNVTLDGADITFKQVVKTKELDFTNDGPTIAKFTTGATNLQNTTITSSSTTRAHHIQIQENNNIQFNVNVGSDQNPFGNFMLTGDFLTNDKTVSINATNFLAGITTDTKQKGIVEFIKAGSVVLNLGDETNELKAVNFNQNGTVREGVYAKDITVAAGKEAFLKVVSSSNGLVLNTGSKLLLNDNATLKANIRANAAGDGSVHFLGSVNINNTIGASGQNVNQIVFAANDGTKIINVGQNLYGNTIEFKNATFRPTTNLIFGGAVSFASTNIDLSNKVLTLENGGASTATGNIKLGILLSDATTQSVGKIVVNGAGTTLNLNTAQSLQINVTDNGDLPEANGRTFTILEKSNNGQITSIDQNKVLAVNSTGNKFATWTFDSASGVLTQRNDAAAKLQAIVGAGTLLAKDAALLGAAGNTGDAKKLQSDLGRLSTEAQVKEAIQRVSNPAMTAGALRESVNAATQITQNRIGVLSQHPIPGIQTTDAGYSGVSAGDDGSKYGAWFSPFFNKSTQKKRGNTAGFEANSTGGTIGGDIMTNNDMTLGLAFSYLKTDIKHKDFKSGDKSKANTYVFSVYGIQQLTNEWFMQGMVMYSSSDVKNREKRITSTGNQTASGKFDTTSYGGEALFGYLQSANGVTITPLAGLAVSKFNDGGYKETGTTFQNLTITKKDTSRLEGVIGGRVQMSTPYMDGMELTPEVHAFIRHDFLNKEQKVSLKLDGMINQFTEKSAKNNRTTYNIGFGFNAKADMYEYGLGYDLNLSNKFTGHQGTLKLRVNF